MQPGQHTHVPTRDEAIAHAVRLLEWAEGETDLKRMERIDELAGSWMQVAALQQEREAG